MMVPNVLCSSLSIDDSVVVVMDVMAFTIAHGCALVLLFRYQGVFLDIFHTAIGGLTIRGMPSLIRLALFRDYFMLFLCLGNWRSKFMLIICYTATAPVDPLYYPYVYVYVNV